MTRYLLGSAHIVLDRSLGATIPDYPVYNAADGQVAYLKNETVRRGLNWAWQLPGLGYLEPPRVFIDTLVGRGTMNQLGMNAYFLTVLDEIARAGASPYVVARPGILWETTEHQNYLPSMSRLFNGDTAKIRAVWQWAWSSPTAIGSPSNLVNAIQIYQAAASGLKSTHDAAGQPYNPIIAASVPGLDATQQSTTSQGLKTGMALSEQQQAQYAPSPALKAAAGVGNTIMGGVQKIGGALADAAKNAPIIVVGVVAVLGGLLVFRFVPRK